MNVKEFAQFYNDIKVDEYIEQDTNAIYHYTSPAGFSSIIDKNQLRFTDRFYLNDKSEGIYVLKLCVENIDTFSFLTEGFKKAFLKNCKKRIHKPQRDRFFVYQCSFSIDKDSLCLWNYYTKSDGIKGYNLKFDSTDISKVIELTPNDDTKVPKLRYGKVVYNEEKQLNILKEIIKIFYEYSQQGNYQENDFISDYLVDKIMQLGVFFKMPCFSIEQEYRLAYDLYLNDDNTYAMIAEEQCFYEKNGIFVPYVDLNFNKKCLVGVGVSPSLDFEATKESILRISGVKYPNLNNDTVYQSEIPVRY